MNVAENKSIWHTIQDAFPRGHTLPYDVWYQRHRVILIVLIFHLPILVAMALFVHSTYTLTHRLTEVIVPLSFTIFVAIYAQSRKLRTAATTIGLMTCSALMVHLSGGLVEMHFHFFAMLALLVMYQEWSVIYLSVAYVIIHHGILGTIAPKTVWANSVDPSTPWKWTALHAGFVAIASAGHITLWKYNEKAQVTADNALRAARTSEAETRGVLEASTDAYVAMRIDGSITNWNPNAEKMFGWTADEAMKHTFGDLLFPAELRDENTKTLEEDLRLGKGPFIKARIETEVRHKDGHVLPVEVAMWAVTTKRERTYSALLHNISERKAAGLALEAARDRAMDASQMKSEFLANMSHEIRTPMNGVIGMSDLLATTNLTTDQQQYLSIIRTSADALLSVINDILDFSKIEAGKLDIQERNFEIRTIISEVTSLVSTAVLNKPLQLNVHVDDDMPQVLNGDGGRVRQVLLNLVGNAVKFTDTGEVVVHCSCHQTTAETADLQIEVRDTGPGISPAVCANLFQSFSQGDTSSTRRHGGTGLGLAISKRLVELMGGEIGVESEPGHGTKFWFRVPVRTGVSESPTEINHTSDEGYNVFKADGTEGSARILLAEDNPINQQVARLMLEALGYQVDTVSTGREAIRAATQNEYTAVLMDCQMPDMDGYEATASLRTMENAPRHLPIIALTANAMVGDAEKCLAAGMDDYLAKPIHREQLAIVLKRWIRNSSDLRRIDQISARMNSSNIS